MTLGRTRLEGISNKTKLLENLLTTLLDVRRLETEAGPAHPKGRNELRIELPDESSAVVKAINRLLAKGKDLPPRSTPHRIALEDVALSPAAGIFLAPHTHTMVLLVLTRKLERRRVPKGWRSSEREKFFRHDILNL